MPTKAINIWSSPRNISTALMYSFAQRKDMSVVDEPLYAHYLRVTNANHPVKAEILESQHQYAEQVIRYVLLAEYDTPHVLHKQMTHHLVDMDWEFLLGMKNILLIRNPREIIASYSKIIPNPNMRDVGIEKQVRLYQYLLANQKLAAVVDTNELLKHPRKVVSELCERLEIPFDEGMLSWEKGARPEDGVWAEHWYANVHQSIGFKTYAPKHVELTAASEQLALDCQPYYDALFKVCIKS